jgi:hypothetical protein
MASHLVNVTSFSQMEGKEVLKIVGSQSILLMSENTRSFDIVHGRLKALFDQGAT